MCLLIWSLLLVPTLSETNNQNMKTIYPWTAREWADCMGLTNTLEENKAGSGAASWARMLEQGLALDELVGMKTSLEREAQG